MKFLKLLTHRAAFVALLLILQLTILFGIILRFQEFFVYFYIFNIVLSVILVLEIINNRSNPAYKIAWLIPIMLLPIFGSVTYLIFGKRTIQRKLQQRMTEIQKKETRAIELTLSNAPKIHENDDAKVQSDYLTNYGTLPAFSQTVGTYLPLGEAVFEAMKEEMEKAETYIFMEYFIIEKGEMWDALLEIMVRKAKEGVDVRLIYDDMGCIFTLPQNYDQQLEAMGIKCSIFNPFIPVLSSVFNNRNHRKITVIDGKVAFTGGNNLADEYINAYEKHGHWKDTGIMLKGEAAWGFTLMFLSLWDFQREENRDYCDYYPAEGFSPLPQESGYFLPYTDTPFDDETLGENVYLNLISRAKSFIYITTPYLVIDNLLMEALCLAAKSGIDVRIQTPHIADKWYVHSVTRSNYEQLIEAGVRIFEYTPGFIHSKTFIVDGLFATVGTINLDYRSLFLHLECGVWMYKTAVIPVMLADFKKTEASCQEMTEKDMKNVSWIKHLGRAVLNVFAPLM